ncbi:MAG: uncharacterized protein JWN93_3320 [Hyphomicrobiales bacterium]|nr:uncharacterized protein [Hyphomicrobiales bacterium]
MNLPDRLQESLKRLASALDHLEAAGERRAMADRVRSDLEEELAVMQDDRARLAVELDGALDRMRVLNTANEDVSQRLERASQTIRSVLDGVRIPAGADAPEQDS